MHILIRLPKNVVRFDFSIPWDDTLPLIERAARHLGSEMEVPGFRPGKVPASHVIALKGRLGVLEKCIDHLVIAEYAKVLEEEHLTTIGNPKITITKLAENVPVEFSAMVALLPKTVLPEYRTLSVLREAQDVSVQELDDALHELARLRNEKEKEIPPLDDAFARALGKFETLLELKNRLQENLLEEKKMREEHRIENALVDLLIEKTIIDALPDLLVESETKNIAADMRRNIEERGVKFEHWLFEIKKSEQEFFEGLLPLAEKRVRASLIMREIALAEKLEATDEELENEINHLLLRDPSENFQKHAQTPEFKRYLRTLLTSRKTMQFLKDVMVK